MITILNNMDNIWYYIVKLLKDYTPFKKTHTQFHTHTYHRYTLLGKHIDVTEHYKTRQQENEENRIQDT